MANCRVSIETVASPVFRSFPGNGKKFRRKMTIITADLSLRKYKVFRKTANPRAVTLSISIAIRFSFRYRTIVSIGYFHRTTTSFLLGESLDPPQFCPFLTSIGVIRRSCPVEFRPDRGSFYFVRHIIRAAPMRTGCIHRGRRSDWVKINCSELQLCMESVSGWSVIFNALIWSLEQRFQASELVCKKWEEERTNDDASHLNRSLAKEKDKNIFELRIE